MKRFLPVLLIAPLIYFSLPAVFARDIDQVGKELDNINYSEIPYGVRMMDANIQITTTPGVTSAPIKSDAVKGYMVKEGSLRNFEAETQVDTNIFASILRGLGSLLASITSLFDFGNQKAVNVIGAMAPCGLADKALGVDNPNCKDGKIVFNGKENNLTVENDKTKVLGMANTDPMENGLDLGYCQQLPYGTGDCLNNNTPFMNITPVSGSISPSPVTMIISPAASVTPVSDFPPSLNKDLACANNPPSKKLAALIKQAAQWKGIPPALLASFACVEGQEMWNLTDDQLDSASQEGGKFGINCIPQNCSAAGPLQMTVGVDSNGDSTCPDCPGAEKSKSCPNQWQLFGDAAKEKEALGRSSTNVCNIADALFAAAKKIDRDKNIRDQYATYNNSYATFCAAARDDWNDGNLLSCVTGAYSGNCTECVLKNDGSGKYNTAYCDRFSRAFGELMNYCQFVNRFSRQWDKIY